MKKAPVFQETARYYLQRLENLSVSDLGPRLGLEVRDRSVILPVLGRTYRFEAGRLLAADGRQAPFEVLVVAARYLLADPVEVSPDPAWSAYREFPDAAPLVSYFERNAEIPIARAFAGRVPELAARCGRIGGQPLDGNLPYDVAVRIPALPRIPVFLLFNDADPEFDAACRLIFERRASAYLDMESVAILGVMLAVALTGEHGA
jgi:hypothetical protein